MNEHASAARDTNTADRSSRWRPRLGVGVLTLLVAAFIIGVDNQAFWSELSGDTGLSLTHRLGFAAATAVFLIGALSFLMSLFAFRFVYKPFLVALLVLAAFISYFMTTYGSVIDDTMIINTLDTDSAEAAGLFSWALVGHMLLFGALPALAVIAVRIQRRRLLRQAVFRILFALTTLVVALTALGVKYKDFSLVLRDNRELRMYINPTYAIFSAFKVATRTVKTRNIPLQTIGVDARRTAAADQRGHRKVMIFVVGETTRAADWGLDGYKRHTTPELAKLGVLNFPDAHSCGTSTAVSVPCMFSADGREQFDESTAAHTENLLDVLQRAGVSVRWEENQAGGCKGVCARVPTKKMRVLRIPGVCGEDRCLDAIFLHGLAKTIDQTQGDMLIVMHTMGSHGPNYYRRYPKAFRVFSPECRSNRPQDCSAGQLTNSYDNTVRYVDAILARLIGALKKQAPGADTALMYLSDHGESLGENGLYLHGFPYMIAPSAQTHIPMIAWLSPGFVRDSGLQTACLRQQTRSRVSQDNVFDTVMGLMDVRAGVYDRGEDIFAPCRTSNGR